MNKRKLSLCLLIGFLVLSIAFVFNIVICSPVSAAPPTVKVKGNRFVDPSGQKVVLRGLSIIFPNSATQFASIEFQLDLITDASKGWYTKILRVPVDPAYWNDGPVDERLAELKKVVDLATKKGLYVIIDWHYIDDPRAHGDDTNAFWETVAPVFSSYGNVFYEIFNEVRQSARDGVTWTVWKNAAQPWINTIRRKKAPNVILTCAPAFCDHIREAATAPFNDPMFPDSPNIAQVAHVYPKYWSRSPNGTDDYAYEFDPVLKKMPVMVTEWGWDRDYDNEVGGDERSFGVKFRKFLDSRGVGWTAWCVSNTRDWFPALFNPDWTPRSSPRYHGKFTQRWLAEKKDADQPKGGRAGKCCDLQ